MVCVSILNEDILNTISREQAILENYRDKNVLVTGATGLIGEMLLKTLATANDLLGLNMSLHGLARSSDKVNTLFSQKYRNSITFEYQDIREKLNPSEPIDYIFHTAAITQSKLLVQNPVEAFETQVVGTYNVLQYATANDANVVYLSSMEIYGQPFTQGLSEEKDLGYVNPLIIRNGYPESKRSCEFLVSAFANEYQTHAVSARLAQTFGPGVHRDDTRVFAQFIRSAINREDIVLHTDGSSRGNYCYLQDTISALLLLMVKGIPGESYNVVNESTSMTIKEMANLVSKEFGNGNVKIEVDHVRHGYAPKVSLRMSSKKLRSLGWKSTYDLTEMFNRTIKSFKEE